MSNMFSEGLHVVKSGDTGKFSIFLSLAPSNPLPISGLKGLEYKC